MTTFLTDHKNKVWPFIFWVFVGLIFTVAVLGGIQG